MLQWTHRSILGLPEDTQASRWIHGSPQPGRGIGPHCTLPSPQGDQGQVDKVQKGEDPKAHQLTQDFWKTPDEELQMFVPQTKQKTQPSSQPSLSQAVSAEQGQV